MKERPANRPSRMGNVRNLVLMALFIAIIMILAFTNIGYINLPFIKATTTHIPVIIGSILLGPQIGAVLGCIFGLTSLVNNTLAPSVLSFCFSPVMPVPGTSQGSFLALVICFVPRILVGVVPYYIYRLFRWLLCRKEAKPSRQAIALAVASASGAITNTVFVMGLIFVLFKNAYAAAKGISSTAVLGAIMGVVFTNGLMETLAAVVIAGAICFALMKALRLEPKLPTAQPEVPAVSLSPKEAPEAAEAEPEIPEVQPLEEDEYHDSHH